MLPSHGSAVLEIFAQGVEGGNATFDQTVPTWEEWDKNHLQVCRFVLENDGIVAGWAALKPFSYRACYQGVAEVSIYLSDNAQGKGYGQALLSHLITESENKGFWMLQAGIFPENIASMRLHEKNGFRTVGFRERIAKMNGVWRNVNLLERRSELV